MQEIEWNFTIERQEVLKMNKLAIWLMVCVLLVCAVFAPKVVYAWPDPVLYPEIRLTVWENGNNGNWVAGIYQGERWPDNVAGRMPTNLDVPPQLDIVQAFRWKNAMSSAKPRLAELYGISPEIAKLYGAKYITIGKGWTFSWQVAKW